MRDVWQEVVTIRRCVREEMHETRCFCTMCVRVAGSSMAVIISSEDIREKTTPTWDSGSAWKERCDHRCTDRHRSERKNKQRQWTEKQQSVQPGSTPFSLS